MQIPRWIYYVWGYLKSYPSFLTFLYVVFLLRFALCTFHHTQVRDYRFVSNGGDYSGDDFPKVNRVSLRLGTECVVKDLSSIVDASWTYNDQLVRNMLSCNREGCIYATDYFQQSVWMFLSCIFQIAESVILNALQPKLDLNPTSCLEMLCSSKKVPLFLLFLDSTWSLVQFRKTL